MTSKYTPIIFFGFSLALLLFGVLVPWILKKKSKKDGLPPAQPLNRRERRAAEQKKEQFEQKCIAAEEDMKRRVATLRYDVNGVTKYANDKNMSLYQYTKDVLGLVENFFNAYEREAAKMHVVDRFMPNLYYAVMHVIAIDIKAFAGQGSFQPIAMDLIKFVERQFGLASMTDVMARNKGQVQFNDRCDAMARSILHFFLIKEKTGLGFGRLLPFDYLNDAELTEWEEVRRSFNRHAIEGHYVELMRDMDKMDHAERTRHDRQDHDNNRRQRARRIAKQSNRRRSKR